MEITIAEFGNVAARLEPLLMTSVSARNSEIAQVCDELNRERVALARVRQELSEAIGIWGKTRRVPYEGVPEVGENWARVRPAEYASGTSEDKFDEARSHLTELRDAIADFEAEIAEANARILDPQADLVIIGGHSIEHEVAFVRAAEAQERAALLLNVANAERLSCGKRVEDLGARLAKVVSSRDCEREQLAEARAALCCAIARNDSCMADRSAAISGMARLRIVAGRAKLDGLRHAWIAADAVRQSIVPLGNTVLTNALKLSLDAGRGWTSRRERSVMRELSRSGLFVPTFYAAIFQQHGLRPPRDLLLHFVRAGAALGLDPGPLFDTAFYLRRNPDVALANVVACLHFLRNGGFEGRKPNALFDSRAYLHDRPDVASARVNPLVHYLRYGAAEGQRVSPFFDAEDYAREHHLRSGSADALAHALGVGRQALLSPCELFDMGYYLKRYPDALASGMHPVEHYEHVGADLGYKPHPYFDTSFYLHAYPDVRDSGLNPLAHFIDVGRKELRSPNVLFDPRWYMSTYSDVGSFDPFRHYIEVGVPEMRSPDRDFDPSYYLDAYPDVRMAGVDPLEHFLDQGIFEGNRPNPEFDPVNFLGGRADLWGSLSPTFLDYLQVRPAAYSIAERACPQLFSGLAWQFKGRPRSRSADYSVIFVSHAADRTGAPICLLKLVEQLSLVESVDCRVIVHNDGELTSEFSKYVPVLRIDDVGAPSRTAAIAMVARLAKADVVRGVVVTNTAATGEYSDAFSTAGFPVLAWLHELPTSVDAYLGGDDTIATIARAATRILTPSDFVAAALTERYDLDAQQFATIRNGTDVPREQNVGSVRAQVRDEFGLPPDAKIVLACGTFDIRKGADLFVQVAYALNSARAKPSDTWFLWVGHPYDATFRRWIEHDIALLGMCDRILIAGQRWDTAPYFAASDVFALTSREDPFPMVNMEALSHGLPVVCFEGAGGAAEMLGGERGIVVPYANVGAMADAIGHFLDHSVDTRERGLSTAATMAAEHSWRGFAKRFLQLLASSFGFFEPKQLKVSVVIPNYNYSRYLPERLDSIFTQSRRPHEIIFLDDHSTDDSVAVAKRLAASSSVQMQIIVNDVNSGSPFAQWAKGIALAKGDLVWIAEADDWCKPDFLHELVPAFYDDRVTIAYSQSAVAGPQSQIFAPDYRYYTDSVSPTRWRSSYSVSGLEEISLTLSQMNTIPNASAVLLRKSAVADAERSGLLGYRLCGDWWLYVATARKGRLAFVNKPLNFHRRHDLTVTHSMEREIRSVVEALMIKLDIFEKNEVPRNLICRSIASSAYEFERLSSLHELGRSSVFVQPDAARILDELHLLLERRSGGGRLKILTVLPDLEVGGGQIAGIRLANAFALTSDSFIVNARPDLFDTAVIDLIGPDVTFLEGCLEPTPWSFAAASIPGGTCEGEVRRQLLSDLIRFHRIDVIISHVWWADRFTYAINSAVKVPWIIRMHGCYESLTEHPEWDPEFYDLVGPMLTAAAGVIYSTPRNLDIFKRCNVPYPGLVDRLFNGFDAAEIPVLSDDHFRQSVDDFVFCLCSRALPEKGWEDAIVAVDLINSMPPHERAGKTGCLVLVGGGPFADELALKYAHRTDLTFLGQRSPVVDVLVQCDVGLLPSRFPSESLPSTVVEYLACGLPTITTDIGSIVDMVSVDGRTAGLVLPLSDALTFAPEDLSALMLRYMVEPNLYATHKANARYVFEAQFDLRKVAAEYVSVFMSAV